MALRKTGLVVFTLLFLLAGCGLKEGTVQKEKKSYLMFTGNTENATVYIDEFAPINLSGHDYDPVNSKIETTPGTKQLHFQLPPGKHVIVVKRSDQEIVRRIILLGNETVKEIQVP